MSMQEIEHNSIDTSNSSPAYKIFLSIRSENLQPISYSIDSVELLEIFKLNPKLLVRLRLFVENKSLYEAHQLFKTINFR